MFSRRSSVDLTPNLLATELERARGAGRRVLDLTEANPTAAGIPQDAGALAGAFSSPGWLRYEPAPFGLAFAREAVARELTASGVPVDASRIVLTASTSEAYAFLFKLVADPGDEVLVPAPSYPLFEHLARLESVRPVPYRLAYDGAWHLDMDSVRAAVTPRTRAIVVVHPNNPTGSYCSSDELRSILALGLPVVSDEVFAAYPLRERADRVRSILQIPEAPLVFALGGLSKLAALPQVKLAWIAAGGDRESVAGALARLEIIVDAYLSVGAPVQHALPALLRGRALAERAIADRTRRNLEHVRVALRSSAVTVLDVEGGWYATLRLPATRSEEGWVLGFLQEDGVYVHPGHFFDFESDGHAYAIISLLTIEPDLLEAIRRIAARVDAWA